MRGTACVALVAAGAAAWGCGSSRAPTAPAVPPVETDAVTINGPERLGWSQIVSGAGDALSFKYRLRIDDRTTDLQQVTCNSDFTGVGSDCSAPLPPLTAGRHVLLL